MANDQLVLVLNELASARNPQFTAQAAVDVGGEPGAPSLESAGVDVEDAISAILSLKLREDASTFRVVVTVITVDDSATYTVTLNGTAFNYAASGGDTAIEILNGLQAVVDASGDFNAAVDATALELVITGADEYQYTHTVGATGSGALAELYDATQVSFRVWGLPKNQPGTSVTWYRIPIAGVAEGGTVLTVDRNWAVEVRCPGYDRLFIEVVSTDGQVVPAIGPAIEESES